MSSSTNSTSRYFQLTPEILVEYTYNNVSSAYDQTGDASDHIGDFENDASVISNGYCGTRTFYWRGVGNNFVLPINKSESKFIQCVNGTQNIWDWNQDFYQKQIAQSSDKNDDIYDDMLIDRFKLHFTSRNYLGSYDGYIISVHIYDGMKNKVGLLSQYIRKTDDPDINKTPVLINQKLYTTYKEFVIPNVYAIIASDELENYLPGASELRNALFPQRSVSPNYDILPNSPIMMSIYGVKTTYINNNYEYYNVERLNTIYIPIVDKSNELTVKIEEADDGDYFMIHPVVNDSHISFSDYIYNLSDGHPEQYIVFYELELTEHYTYGSPPQYVNKVTHREQYIINAAEEDDDINEELDGIMYYRPIVIHSGTIVSFTINVKLSIINTFDNTTTVRKSSLDYGLPENDPQSTRNLTYYIPKSPKKYGKKMSKIYLGEIPAKVNVYNKKPDLDRDGVKITNTSSNVRIENHQHSVIGFIECANVGVSIEQVPKEVLQ